MTVEEICSYLKNYDGRPLKLMEVCGSHTAAIAKYGIRDILSPKIRFISGPGCPVCVTPSAYIDRLIELAKKPQTCVVTFGDLLRVPGSVQSLNEARAEGAEAVMVYSPMETVALAKEHPEKTYIFAAVGFETTAPVYTLLLEEAERENINNIQILTALKTMPSAIRWIVEEKAGVDGFLAPGHVCAVTGYRYFEKLAETYHLPFAVAGFGDTELLTAIYGLVRMAEQKEAVVKNFYPAVVEAQGNEIALEKLKKYFKPCDAVWRGMGLIEQSGLILRGEYGKYDAGSSGLTVDKKKNSACCCGQILIGRIEPKDCPLFGKVCTPDKPQGACMVSYEGSCHQQFLCK